MRRYFDNCRTAEDLKKAYRQAAKELHPDAGGREDEFKSMQAEFSAAWSRLKNIHITKDGEKYERETQETAEEFMSIIEELIRFKDVEVEICGSWIWLFPAESWKMNIFLIWKISKVLEMRSIILYYIYLAIYDIRVSF